MIVTTLEHIRSHAPCRNGWETLLRGLKKTIIDNEPLPYAKIVEINGLDDALWCCRAEPQYAKEWKAFSIWCVRRVRHLLVNPLVLELFDTFGRREYGTGSGEEFLSAYNKACGSNFDYGSNYSYMWAARAVWQAISANAGHGARQSALSVRCAIDGDDLATDSVEYIAQTEHFLSIVK